MINQPRTQTPKPRSRVQSLRSLVLGNNPGKALHPSAIYRIIQCDAPDPGFRQICQWGPEFLVSGHTVSASYQEGCEPRVYFFNNESGRRRTIRRSPGHS
jgi:hypothetical protein